MRLHYALQAKRTCNRVAAVLCWLNNKLVRLHPAILSPRSRCFWTLVWCTATGCLTASALPAAESDAGMVVRSWNTKHGLPQNTVNTLLQTRDGYLWIGTKDGLTRFDGVRFRRFGEEEGLPRGEISALLETRDGALWVGTPHRGLFRWQTGMATNMWTESRIRYITALAETRDGAVWIGTMAGLDRWLAGRITPQGELNGFPKGRVLSLYTDRAGTLWVGSAVAGIFQLRDGKFISEPAPFDFPLQKPGYCFLEDQTGGLWLSIGNGLLLCKQDGVWQTRGSSDGVPFIYVNCLAQAMDGRLWAGSGGAGLAYLKDGRFWPFTTQNGLSSDYVISALADREGNVWAGTFTAGLNRLTRKQLSTLAAPQGLTNEIIRSVAESADGTLWVVVSTGGLYRSSDGHFEPYKSPTLPEGQSPAYYHPGMTANADSILAAHDGTLWLGGGQELFHLGISASKEFKVNPDTKWLRRGSTRVTALAEDASQAVWVGTSDGQLQVWQNGEFSPAPGVSNNSSVIAIACATDGTVWAGTSGAGVLQLRTNGLAATLTSRQGLANDFITALHAGRDGTLWIGTEGGGLDRWKDGHCLHFTARQGLPETPIVQIVEDDAGDLWLGSAHGICQVRHDDLELLAKGEIATLQLLTFGEAEGMLAEECSAGFCPNCLKSRDGRLCFTTTKGLVVIDPKQIKPPGSPPVARLEEIVFNQKTIAEAGGGGKLVIPPGRGNLEFHYTGLGHPFLENLQFRYHLIGADPDWVEAGMRRVAYYTQLPPGHYWFQVATRANGEPWSQNSASVELVLQPHYYETWWFFVSLFSLAALILTLFVRFISHRKLQHRLHLTEMQNAVANERSRIAKDIHDDLGASLTQVTMLSELGQAAAGPPDDRSQTFAKIAGKSRLAIQSLDEIVWAVNPKNDNLPRLVRYICRHADESFDSSNIRCWQKVPDDLPNVFVRAEIRHNLFLAVKEALHNVLKHSHATQIWLNIWLEHGTLHLEIKDDGNGFSLSAANFNRSGLKNMQTRLAEIGGTTEFESRPGQGTRLHFAVKLGCHLPPPLPHGISMP